VNGELWKLKDDAPPAPVVNRTRRLVFVGLLGLLLICGVTFALLVRAKPSQNPSLAYDPNKPRGLRLFDAKITFIIEPLQTVDVRLPCSGLLTINLTFPEKTTLNVFLVSAEECEKMKARQVFAHIDGFDARPSSGSHQQAGRLPAGRYCLVLLDESKSRSVVAVNAHLSDLK
jgi:hypothetical protein